MTKIEKTCFSWVKLLALTHLQQKATIDFWYYRACCFL